MARFQTICAGLLGACVYNGTAFAEEGGSGHYLPGSMASFVDSVSPKPVFLARYNLMNYTGDVNISLPFAGLLAEGAEADSWANGLTLFYAPEWGVINDTWNYAMSASIPYVSMDVTANVIGTAKGATVGVRRHSKEEGLGDIIFQPVMLNQKVTPDFNINYRVNFYAPTGDYEVGRLANLGKNYWSFEPTVGMMYFNQKTGLEGSLFTGVTFNTKNQDTDYHTGTQFHFDGTLAQHFPLAKGLAGVGVSGFYYQQLEGDSGDGATFGDFKGRTVGVGPVVSFSRSFKDVDFTAEAKWLTEVDTKNRLEGNYLWLKLLFKF